MLSYSHLPGHYTTLGHCHSRNPIILATIDALSKSDGIQNLKIADLCRHLLFDSSENRALLAGVDDADDEDTSFAGVHDKDTSLTGVPAREPVSKTTVMINADNSLDTYLITTLQTPMRLTTIQAKHPYSAPEATYPFTVQLMNHHNILWMRKSQMM